MENEKILPSTGSFVWYEVSDLLGSMEYEEASYTFEPFRKCVQIDGPDMPNRS
jgi:hypothetical protein